MKTLVAGWFSFENMGASAGDLLVRDLACEWLEEAGRSFDVAVAPPFEGGVDWRSVEPSEYSEVVFVCGPFGNGEPLTEFLPRFQDCRLLGLNLTLLQPLEEWNPFDLLLERDSSRTARPDLAFLSQRPRVPVVGVILIDAQPEYGERDLHEQADRAIQTMLESRELAVVRIDTRLDRNTSRLRSAASVESLIAHMDAVVTTRLHGLVLALKNGVPALAVDTVVGGAKITRQAETLGWPHVYPADASSDHLQRALDACLSDAARGQARIAADRARQALAEVAASFIHAVRKG